MTDRWEYGQTITRREILGFEPTGTTDRSTSWFGKSWLDLQARVVRDTDDELVLYVAPGSPFGFPENDWPTPDGLHPWHERSGWQGHGCLMVHQPGEHHAVWHFWTGPERTFAHWYINVQTAYRREQATFETQDLELDFVVNPDHSWELKDWEAVAQRVVDTRFSAELAEWIYDYGRPLIERLDAGDIWWDQSWADWTPPPGWA